MNRRSIFNEKEAVEAGADGGRGGRVHVELSGGDAGGKGHPRPFLRKSPETADVREGPHDDGRTEDRTRHHNGEFVKDVRVLPIDEGVGVVEEDELSRAARRPWTGASGPPPRSRRTTRSRRLDRQNCGHRAQRTSFWEHLWSISCLKKCIKKCHRVNPERSALHVPQNLSARR